MMCAGWFSIRIASFLSDESFFFGQFCLKNLSEALVCEPYVTDALAASRRAIFPGYHVVADAYATLEQTFGASEWRHLFESAGAIGPVRMRTFEKEKLGVWPSYTEIKHQIAQKLEISFEQMRDIETQSKFGWKVRGLAFSGALPFFSTVVTPVSDF